VELLPAYGSQITPQRAEDLDIAKIAEPYMETVEKSTNQSP